jgi:hypothetical protein
MTAAKASISSPSVPDRSSDALTIPSSGTEGAWIIRPSIDAGFRFDPGVAAIATIIARSESSRSGEAKCSIPSTTAPHRNVAAVDASPIQTRCMSSNNRPTLAGHASFASARMRLITPGVSPFQSSAGPGAAALRNAAVTAWYPSRSSAHPSHEFRCPCTAMRCCTGSSLS